MILKHNGTSYECHKAIKCADDCYIKLYDEAGNEIASFFGISNFDDYEIVGGEFTYPSDCNVPLKLTLYTIGGRTIQADDWIENDEGVFEYEITSDLISSNIATCNVMLFFAQGTELEFTSIQSSGSIKLQTKSAPTDAIVIESIHIERVAR